MLTSTLLAAALISGVTSPGLSQTPAKPQATSFALKANAIHLGDGRSVEDGFVLIENGLIKSVGDKAPSGVRVIEVDGEISPGLVALRDSTGAGRERNESTRKVTPDADLARAFDPSHPSWKHVVQQGITTVVLTPSSSRIAGGTAAVVSPGTGEIVKRGALVPLGMSSRSIDFNVEPTSYAGLYRLLTDAFANAGSDSAIAKAKAGELPVLMEVVTRTEALHAITFAKEHKLSGALVGLRRGEEIADEIKAANLAVVLEPFGAGASPALLKAALSFAKKQIPFAFTADSESRGAASLRMTAAALMRRGLDADTALMAMTSSAAKIAGVDGSHGSVAPGKTADLVVWSGAPTDLTSRVLHVFASGQHVYDASKESAQ